MNVLDIGLAVLLLLGLVRGFMRGFLREIFGLVGVIAGLSLALVFSSSLAHLLVRWMPAPIAYSGAFVLIFFGSMGLSALIGRGMTSVTDRTPLGILNRILGGGLGFGKALVAVLVFLAVLHAIPGGDGFMKGSRLAPWAESSGVFLKQQARRLALPRAATPPAPGRRGAESGRPDTL